MSPSGTITAGFPRDLLQLLRCNRDAGQLSLVKELCGDASTVVQARMRCDSCGAEYDIEDGIARLLYTDLTAEDKHEIAIRDAQNADALPRAFMPPPSGWRSEPSDLLEIPDHLAELDPGGRRILEIGCGDGRFTILMARMEAHVLAVDFSIKALQVLASRLSSGIAPTAYQVDPQHKFIDLHGLVGLVHADASHFCVAPRSFDRALSTTPLDSRDERMTMYRTIAEALTDQGRFVGSVENDDLNRSLLGLPVARRYSSGIFIEHFDSSKVRREVAPYFSKLRIRPIRPRLPFCHRLASSWVLRLSRLVAVTPVIRHFGEILLFRAERPVRPPREGVHRPGSKPAKHLYRWYMLKIGKAPLWEGHEPV